LKVKDNCHSALDAKYISDLSFLPGLFSIYLSPKEIILEFYELSGKLEVANPFSPNCIFGIYFKGIIGEPNKNSQWLILFRLHNYKI